MTTQFASKLLLFLFISPYCALAIAQSNLIIVPAGDSITEGCCSGGSASSYRKEFSELMNASGCSHQMEGSRLVTNSNSSFQSYHEGYSGWRAIHFIAGAVSNGGPKAIATIVMDETPDVLLIHLGSNDLNGTGPAGHATVDDTLDKLKQLVNKANEKATSLAIGLPTILLAKPIPWYNPGPSSPHNTSGDNANIQADIESLGNKISMAIAANEFPSNVYEVDPVSGFSIDMMQADQIHPNVAGEKHLAQAFFTGMVDAGLCTYPVEYCNGELVTVSLAFGQTPTSNADVILGTASADNITAMGGDDTICSQGGDDIISAGRGNDWINAGPGNDTVDGGTDDDTIFGDDGVDTLNGGPGNDTVYGEDGDDFLKGNSGNDTLHGGNGIDQIIAGSGNDTVTTGSGGNHGTGLQVNGGAGDDHITGGPDDDEIRGATGNDTLLGGGGNDTLYGGGGNDTINGQDGSDTLKGNGSKDTMIGGNGNDDMDGGGSDDVMSGGNGNDVMRGSTGNDELSGGADDDEIYGGGGNDVLRGNRGDDELFGGGSNDNLIGGSDTDSCNGDGGTNIASSCESTTNVP